MRTRRLVPICVVALMAMLASGAFAKDAKKPGPPSNVRGFVLTPTEAPSTVFSRTPAFTWQPVRGALCYEFELSTAKGFNEASVIWSNVQYGIGSASRCAAVTPDDADTTGKSPADSVAGTTGGDSSSSSPAQGEVIPALKVPAVSVDVALPWFTGTPYALYAHARAITQSGPTAWSKPFGFNMQWSAIPTPAKTSPGLLSWTPVEGATGYEVMFQGPTSKKVVTTSTNVVDERELWSFHDASWFQSVTWRIRAVRRVFGQIPNGLPAVSYGPWSAVYRTANPASLSAGPITLTRAVSDVVSVTDVAKAHQLMPAIAWNGTVGIDARPHSLFRAYVSTDAGCVNTVFRGAVVGSPAYAPRTSGPLKLPASAQEVTDAASTILENGAEGTTLAADASKVAASEVASGSGTETGTASTSASPGAGAKVDLPDVDFPSTRYYYTVVGVDLVVDAKTKAYTYVEAELPQDVCAAGRVLSFGKRSRAVVTSSPAPLVIGLSPDGKLLTATARKPRVYSTPLVTWMPALGATAYEVQWSRSAYPWKPAGRTITYATSSLLTLPTGTWYYRVRGLNQAQLRKSEMQWSKPTPVEVARPTFKVVRTATAMGGTKADTPSR